MQTFTLEDPPSPAELADDSLLTARYPVLRDLADAFDRQGRRAPVTTADFTDPETARGGSWHR